MNNLNNRPRGKRVIGYSRQTGMTLIVSLVILISLTMLGVASMQSTRTEIAMAGNLRKAGIAFNAAEAGLRAAENFVDKSDSIADFNDPTVGLYAELDNDPSYNLKVTWDASQTATTNLPYVKEQPKFIIHYLGDRSQNEVAAVNIGGYGTSQPGKTISNFRITARGTGQGTSDYRFIQSYYGLEY